MIFSPERNRLEMCGISFIGVKGFVCFVGGSFDVRF